MICPEMSKPVEDVDGHPAYLFIVYCYKSKCALWVDHGQDNKEAFEKGSTGHCGLIK